MKSLFKEAKLHQLYEQIGAGKIDLMDMFKPGKLPDIASVMSESIGKRKEEVEIFSAIYLFSGFYDSDVHVCFYMHDSFNPQKDPVNSLHDLIRQTKENSQADFLLLDSHGFRQFQLKRYVGPFETEALAKYIEEKLAHYGGAMDSVNLLFLIQSKGGDFANMDLQVLHERLLAMGLTFKGEILLSFNLQDEFNVISRLFPTLASRKIPVERSI